MQERQVTLDGQTIEAPATFMVLATQNPIEQEGTYPLPEAQLDRFLFKIRIDYPSAEEEVRLTQYVLDGKTGADLDVAGVATVLQPETLINLQQSTAMVTTDDRVIAYAVAIVRATREAPLLAAGAGPRGFDCPRSRVTSEGARRRAGLRNTRRREGRGLACVAPSGGAIGRRRYRRPHSRHPAVEHSGPRAGTARVMDSTTRDDIETC